MHTEKKMRNIWFFVGWILLVIGLIELAAGVYGLFFPSNQNTRLTYLHTDLWWGMLIAVSGFAFLWKNWNKYIDVQK